MQGLKALESLADGGPKDMEGMGVQLEGHGRNNLQARLRSCIIRKLQIKTTVRHHFTPTRMEKRDSSVVRIGEHREVLEHLDAAGSNVRWGSCFEIWQFLSSDHLFDPAIPLPGICPRKMRANARAKTCTWMFTATLFIGAKKWKPPKCTPADGWVSTVRSIIQWNTIQL